MCVLLQFSSEMIHLLAHLLTSHVASQESDGGLYVSLYSLIGLCKNHLDLHYQKTTESLYLHILKTARPPTAQSEDVPPVKKPTRLAIGVEGGFEGTHERVEYDETLAVVALPEKASVSWPSEGLPQKVRRKE